MALRLRYEIDTPEHLREHVHMVDGAGYFFFDGADGAKGTPAALEIVFTRTDQTALLRGVIWARPSSGGVWLELEGAAASLSRLDLAPRRADLRMGSEQLVLLQADGCAALLCRLLDVSGGGARIAVSAADAGSMGNRVRIGLPEAGPDGQQLLATGRVVWTSEREAGVVWDRDILTSRLAVRRLLELAAEEWEGARATAHPPECRQQAAALMLG